MDSKPKRKEIFTYEAPWTIYGMSWSCRKDKPYRLAVGSYLEEYNNFIQIIEINEDKGEFQKVSQFSHPYPPTKIQWLPDMSPNRPDILATTGDYLRIWENGPNGVKEKYTLNSNKNSEYCAPLTSFDWSLHDYNIIGVCSIDTTCTIWDIEYQKSLTQLIAHDKEVYDICFAKSKDIFASTGQDGSIRMFDLRSLDTSTIIYESPDNQPLLRLSWNKQDPNYMATFMMDSSKVIILDVRVPSTPVAELTGHSGPINGVTWAPHTNHYLCSVGDDSAALIWDISGLPKPIEDPILAYNADSEINQLQWSSLQPDWISIAYDKRLQILKV